MNTELIKATVSYKDNRYILFILKKEDDEQKCIKAFVYKHVKEFLLDLQIFVNKNSWWNLKNTQSIQDEVDYYNSRSNLENIVMRGNEILIIGNEITVYPRLLPVEDKAVWIDFIINRFSIALERTYINDIHL
jgi:hypothetical protein